MGKKRERSELEHLRGVNRQLKSENAQLKKLLNRVNFDSVPDTYEEPSKVHGPVCIKCKGPVKLIDMGPKLLYTCSNEDCDHRYIVKKP